MYRDSFFQNTIYEDFKNDTDEIIPAFACVPFQYSLDVGRLGRIATELDEAEQDHALIGFNGPEAVRPRGKGVLTQQWPAIASVPQEFGPVQIGARLGPCSGEGTMRWGTAFHACGMVGGDDSKQLIWVYPNHGGYAGPGFQVAGSGVVLSGEHLALTDTGAYTIQAFSSEDAENDFGSNFASHLELQAAYADAGSELLIPRRGKYRVTFSALAYSDTGLEAVTNLTMRWRLRTHLNDYHLSALVAHGVTKFDPAEDYPYHASRQTRSRMGISGDLPLRNNWALSIQNTSDVRLILEEFIFSVIHIGPVDAVNICPWGDALWE